MLCNTGLTKILRCSLYTPALHLYNTSVKLKSSDWKVLDAILYAALSSQQEPIRSLSEAALGGVSLKAANRMLKQLVAGGYLVKRPETRNGRLGYVLYPTAKLRDLLRYHGWEHMLPEGLKFYEEVVK